MVYDDFLMDAWDQYYNNYWSLHKNISLSPVSCKVCLLTRIIKQSDFDMHPKKFVCLYFFFFVELKVHLSLGGLLLIWLLIIVSMVLNVVRVQIL